ncbi:MAG: recombinase family protein [Patescibacteria group bacterium]
MKKGSSANVCTMLGQPGLSFYMRIRKSLTSLKPKKSGQPHQNRFILYARKSTTSEDRQVASIESQIEVMTEVARDNNFEVVEVLSEAGSGFKIGRTAFNSMIEKIESGEADGIIVWKLSRLSRNPDDAGKIMGLLQRGEIKHIRTVDRNWYPEDNVMMMYVEFGMTNQFSRDLSSDTRRGLVKKAERGWLPNAILPLGYMHSPYKKLGDEEIITDENRFDLIQEGLKLVASGQKTPVEAHSYLVGQGVVGKRSEALPKSTWYKMLVEPLYAGTFEYPIGSGQFYDSKAPRAIEPTEYDAIQVVLGRKDKPRPKTHFLPYTGLMKCGECGCSITAEKKRKVQKNGNVHHYIYYHCTKKKGDCGQPCTPVDTLEKQYKSILKRIKIPLAFHEWAIDEIKYDQEKVIRDRDTSLQRTRTNYDDCLSEIDNLVKKYLEGKVPEDYYDRNLAKLNKNKKTLAKILEGIDKGVDENLEKIDKDLDFAVTARRRFNKGNDFKRREIISYLGSNLILTDHSLGIELRKPLELVAEIAEEVNEVAKRFEPLENADNSVQFKLYLSENPAMGPLPRNTSVVVSRSIERILTAFDDTLQSGLVKLRSAEISVLTKQLHKAFMTSTSISIPSDKTASGIVSGGIS